jgi:hypothetical protein
VSRDITKHSAAKSLTHDEDENSADTNDRAERRGVITKCLVGQLLRCNITECGRKPVCSARRTRSKFRPKDNISMSNKLSWHICKLTCAHSLGHDRARRNGAGSSTRCLHRGTRQWCNRSPSQPCTTGNDHVSFLPSGTFIVMLLRTSCQRVAISLICSGVIIE